MGDNGEKADPSGKRQKKDDDDDELHACANFEKMELCKDDLQAGGPQAVQDAMNNELILETILKNLRTRDLVRRGFIRCVNKKWNKVAITILKARKDAVVGVTGDRETVEALEACIAAAAAWGHEFPFCELKLNCWSTDFEGSPGKWLEVGLLREYSTLFTRLRLDLWGVPDTVIIGLLLDHFNHVERLVLERIKRRSKKKGEKGEKDLFRNDRRGSTQLLKLKAIAMGLAVQCNSIDLTFLSALRKCCPNLQIVENLPSAYLQVLSTGGKLDLVKSLRVCADCFVKNCPRPSRVQALIITANDHEDNYARLKRYIDLASLKPLLESNRETLRRLEVKVKVVGGEKSEDWPTLSNLSVLELQASISFPESVQEIFPALTTIQIEAYEVDKCYCCKCKIRSLLWKAPLLSVTRLEVSACLELEEWKRLFTSVPNVRQVFLNPAKCCILPATSPLFASAMDFWSGVSYFPHLEMLCISPVNLGRTDMDHFFTGISESVVKKMRATPQLPQLAPELIDLLSRERPSLASLSGLRELVVRFTMEDTIIRLGNPCLTHVSLQYGFNMVPRNIKIKFLYDHWQKNAHVIQQYMTPVAERVTFGHWNAHLNH